MPIPGVVIKDLGEIPKGMLVALRQAHPPKPKPEPKGETPPPPPPRLDQIQLDTGYFGFDGGVPVGGYSHLSLFPDGRFNFTGHFHDSGAIPYTTSLVWFVKSSTNNLYVFRHAARVHGLDPGSRDDDWDESGVNGAVSAGWADLSAGYTSKCVASVKFDIDTIVDDVSKAWGVVAAVIAVL